MRVAALLVALSACSDGPAAAAYATRFCEQLCRGEGASANPRCRQCLDGGGGEGGGSAGGGGATGGGANGGGGSGGGGVRFTLNGDLVLLGVDAGLDVGACSPVELTVMSDGVEVALTESVEIGLGLRDVEAYGGTGCTGPQLTGTTLLSGGSPLWLRPTAAGPSDIFLDGGSLIAATTVHIDAFALASLKMRLPADGGTCVTFYPDARAVDGGFPEFSSVLAKLTTLERAGVTLDVWLSATCTGAKLPFVNVGDVVDYSFRHGAGEVLVKGTWLRPALVATDALPGTLQTGEPCSLANECSSRICGARGCLCVQPGNSCARSDACCSGTCDLGSLRCPP